MDELLNQMASPAWWVSVVVAGLLINLFSAYLKPLIDTLATRVWKRARDQGRAAAEQRRQLSQAVEGRVDLIALVALATANKRLRGIGLVGLGTLLAAAAAFALGTSTRLSGWPAWAILALSLAVFALALQSMWRAMECWKKAAVLEEVIESATRSEFLVRLDGVTVTRPPS